MKRLIVVHGIYVNARIALLGILLERKIDGIYHNETSPSDTFV